MLELVQDVRPAGQVSVIPQVVARACLLELSQEELEEEINRKLDENPALELVEVAPSRPIACREDTNADQDLLGRVPAPVGLRDDLRWQLRLACDGEQRRIAEYIVESLDDRGYLTTPLVEISNDLDVALAEVEAALAVVQSLEPPGIGARDLVECLCLQATALPPGEAPPGLLDFLDTEFRQLVAEGDPRAFKGRRGQRSETYLAFIRDHMYPYPASVYRPPYGGNAQEPTARVPDAIVEATETGLQVTIPVSERLALRVDAAYCRLAREAAAHGRMGSHTSIKQLVSSAGAFIANLTHRHRIISRVAHGIITAQESYLTDGPRALKPLTKKELSQALGLHESTVCRATKGKSLMLPGGDVVPFDVFFEDALPAKVTLAQIIRREDPAHPYTDQELAERLAERGYRVARRTISKYRAALGVPPASERKRA